jgi:hypothetical protein
MSYNSSYNILLYNIIYNYINFLGHTPKISCFAASASGYAPALIFPPVALKAFTDQPAVFERYKRPYDFDYRLAIKPTDAFQ